MEAGFGTALLIYLPWEQIAAIYILALFGLGLTLGLWGIIRKEKRMKKLLLICLLLAISGAAEAGHKKVAMNIPLPRPNPERIVVADKGDLFQPPAMISPRMAQNPDPFKTQQPRGETVQVPNPPAGSPINIHLPGQPEGSNFIQYLWMLLIGFIGSMFGIPQLKNAFGKQPLMLDANHPEVKQVIKDTVIHILQSGVLQGPAQALLGQVPGIGPILAGLEPKAKQIILKILAGEDPAKAVADVPAPTTTMSDDLIETILARVEAKLKGKTS